MPIRLAIILSHPVQYYSPWFRHLAARPEVELKVFYLWDFGVKETTDRTFGTSFVWDIPLLDGYDSEFVPNRSKDPGTHHFKGLDNPGVVDAVAAWKPDAVLLFGYNHASHLRLILSRRLAGVRFLFRGDSHELCSAHGWKAKITRLLRSVVFKRFFGFLAVGAANAGYFRASGVQDSKIHHVPHCVDNGRFRSSASQAKVDALTWKHELGIPERTTVVLFAGKFEEKKRPMDLLGAFLEITTKGEGPRAEGERQDYRGQRSEVRDPQESCPQVLLPSSDLRPLDSELSFPPAVLLFVGSGPLERALRTRTGGQLGNTVFFAPFQNQTAMPMVYAAGNVLVLPSFGRGETWGLAVNEAMNLGRPAIVSSHVGCGPDLILPGETGWIFNAGDTNDLKEKLTAALSDPARLKAMGLRAREHVGNYSYERATQALIDVLVNSGKLEFDLRDV